MGRIIKQVSSGGVIYRKEGERVFIALIRRGNGRIWCLPKGIVEESEDLEKTATREVKEETGLDGRIVDKIGEINYWFYDRQSKSKINKTVHFYLLEYLSGSVEDHDFEVEEVRWFPIEEAVKIMNYNSERDIVLKASAIIKGISKNKDL